MPLIERLIGGDDKLSVHEMGATLDLLQSGIVTKTEALERWPELTGQDIADLGDIMDKISGSTLTWNNLESACILGESGKMTAAQIRSKLGL